MRVDVPGSPAAAQVLTEMLRAGLEPWHAQCLAVANPAADAATPSAGLRLVAEGDRLALEGGPAATGAPWALLAFRLYQLWRGAEHRPLRDFVLFDLETTGVDTASCEVIELAAIRVEGGRPTAQFEALVKPVGPIPAASTAVHGIDARTVADAPPLGHVLPDFLTFLGEHDLVAHNGAAFDFPCFAAWRASRGSRPRATPSSTASPSRAVSTPGRRTTWAR
ncbi:MAG: 3'-5' exonuclease [Candidatus Latescibacteria bacterium]|nr:3'-5' exonuclease [Candidatus Latescibacterota bacterium]